MAIPTFRSFAARRKNKNAQSVPADGAVASPAIGGGEDSERTLTPTTYQPGVDIKEATKTRRTWILISAILFFISVIFLILVRLPISELNIHMLTNTRSRLATLITKP